jgi:prepilin-type N-terminal cleavage/methylation domain-containing protein
MQRGFTLIELLIVIAILAILTTVVLLVINPAQLLAESRDAQRLSDLDTLRTAINYYLVTATTTNLGSTATMTVSSTCPFTMGGCITNATTSIDGTGWVTIDLRQSTGGSPISKLPLDPLQTTNYYYAYAPDNTNHTYEIDARLESTKHRDKMKTDGGDKNTCTTYVESTCYYEIGNDPDLNL